MLQLVLRRLLLLIPTLILVTFGAYSLMALVPGDAAVFMAGGEHASPARIEQVREDLGLNDPHLVQYGRWLGNAVQLDFGQSLLTGGDVTAEIRHRLPVTLSILLGSIVIGLALAIPIGLWSGAKQDGLVDRVLLFVTSAGLAVPNFVLAILLINYLAIRQGWFDAVGFTRLTGRGGELDVAGWLRALTLPSIALGVGVAARLARQIRAGVVDVLHEPYIRTAWAKGCRPSAVVAKHVFKNAAMPSVTVAGLLIGGMLGGTVIVEAIFAAPGIGEYLVRAVNARDIPVIQAVAVMFVLAFVLINLVVDIVYGWLNPKVEVA
jgi:peptide/nickel transport system permease protein